MPGPPGLCAAGPGYFYVLRQLLCFLQRGSLSNIRYKFFKLGKMNKCNIITAMTHKKRGARGGTESGIVTMRHLGSYTFISHRQSSASCCTRILIFKFPSIHSPSRCPIVACILNAVCYLNYKAYFYTTLCCTRIDICYPTHHEHYHSMNLHPSHMESLSYRISINSLRI